MSCTTYFTGEAVPVKVGNGSKVTVPFAFTVYVPWFATTNEVELQLAFAVNVDAHNFTLLATSVAGDVAKSFVSTEMSWLVSKAPLEVSFTAIGGAGTTGVNVEVAVWPKMSTTMYSTAVCAPWVTVASATNITTPVDAFKVYVPCPAMVTMPSASQVAGDDPGVIRHVEEGTSPTPDVARPLAPVMVVNVAVPPGITAFESGVATGNAGKETVGVIVAPAS